MWKYNCEKRNKYYDEVIRLYTQEGLGRSKSSRIIPVGETTISRWIRNFADEKQIQVVMKRKSSINPETPEAGI
ncbi:MAG: transposase, partial [Prevotella sp.]|nr:transposase [Prevotella sp.]